MTAPSSASPGGGAAPRSGSQGVPPGPPHAVPRTAIENLVCFVLANRAYALDVHLVREVVHVGAVFPVPRVAEPIVGVFSLRGATVALVHTPRLLAMPVAGARALALIIVRQHQTVCALTIDRLIGVTRFVPSNFIARDAEREPPEVAGFLPDERGGLLTVLESSVLLSAIDRLRFH